MIIHKELVNGIAIYTVKHNYGATEMASKMNTYVDKSHRLVLNEHHVTPSKEVTRCFRLKLRLSLSCLFYSKQKSLFSKNCCFSFWLYQ